MTSFQGMRPDSESRDPEFPPLPSLYPATTPAPSGQKLQRLVDSLPRSEATICSSMEYTHLQAEALFWTISRSSGHLHRWPHWRVTNSSYRLTYAPWCRRTHYKKTGCVWGVASVRCWQVICNTKLWAIMSCFAWEVIKWRQKNGSSFITRFWQVQVINCSILDLEGIVIIIKFL